MTAIQRVLNLKGVRYAQTDLESLGHNLKDWTTQTDATVAIQGSSGRGSPHAVARLNLYHAHGLLEKRKHRNGHQFRATLELVSWAEAFENPYPFPLKDV